HDIEENVDTEVSAAECADNLDRMLRIEKELRVDATYNMLGILLARKRQIIEASNPRHSIAFHSFNHSLNDMTQLRQCRDVDLRVRGYRPPRSRITAELSDYNLTFWNFEWLASSVFSLGSEACRIENGLVKIPIAIDDYPLVTRAVDYQDWEPICSSARARKSFSVSGYTIATPAFGWRGIRSCCTSLRRSAIRKRRSAVRLDVPYA
ncbi:MAG TPA: hypothetical protein VFY74_08710, partial [Methyloceanibacter sp.]|nr:hypothetical protein [Methyloceanibacter sp.]